jgi:hypothetical protein
MNESQKATLPITAKRMEGKRAKARRERVQEGKARRQNAHIILYNTKHTHTHTCFQSIALSVSLRLSRS